MSTYQEMPTPAVRAFAVTVIVLSVFMFCAATFWSWSGRNATRELTFEQAMSVLRDPSVPLAQRKAAASILAARCRIAIRELKDPRSDMLSHADLLLLQIRAILDAPR